MKKLNQWLLGENTPGPKQQEVVAGFQSKRPSFSDLLAITDFCDERNLFLLNDGVSVGSGFELGSISAEAATTEYLKTVFTKIKDTFAAVVPLYKEDPWVMQLYVSDDYTYQPILDHIERFIAPEILITPFTQDYLKRLNDLFSKMKEPQGLFLDPKSDTPFRIRRRRIRVLFYRRYHTNPITREAAVSEHEEVLSQINQKLASPGLSLKHLTGKAYYDWLVNWFNPNPAMTDGCVEKLLGQFPYPQDQKPANFSHAQNSFFNLPESDAKGFVFDGLKHRVLYVDSLKEAPMIGLLSRERPQAHPKHRYALLDKLTEGAIYTMQVIFSSDEALEAHLLRIEKSVIGTSLKPTEVKRDIQMARDELASNNRLFWVTQAILYRGKDEEECEAIEKALHNLFIDAKMPLLASRYDLHPLNSYLNVLPFNFDALYARKHLYLDRLVYASELAALLPVYGRFQGAKHLPCFTFFNRLGEPVFFDILNPKFITQNSHMALFANSGGGKSVATGWMINSLMATKNARIVLFEMGNSFDRMLIHCKAHGKVVKQLLLSNQKDRAVPLNPFCEAYKALPEIKECLNSESALKLAQKIISLQSNLDTSISIEDQADESRCYLAELSLALRTMITEANNTEEEKFTLADETLIIEILIDAILTSFHADIPQMLTEHVLSAFERRLLIEGNLRKNERILDMHDRLKSYVINTNKAQFFNVPTEPLGEFDIFHVDISAIKDDKGKLALVMVSLLPRILAIAEATQNDNRPTFLFIDEAHIQFQIDVVVAVALLIAKVARKLGLWLVPITQNIADLSSEKATKILSLIETFILLGLDEKELHDLKKFKSLTSQQEALIRDIDSQKGLYAEAVLLGSRFQGLFRVIPPRYLLALLLNEKSEKAERHKLEQEHDVLIAAEIIGKRLENQTHHTTHEHDFYDE